MNRRLAIAPMLDWTDRHARYFFRLFSRNILLYTEMVTCPALIHGDRARFLAHHDDEHPVAIQLGGSDPAMLAECAALAEEAGFDEINLNVGCPSDRVQSGRFGACLMAEPDLVARCVEAMIGVATVPVTVKSRTGIDHRDGYGFLADFVDAVAGAGCRVFIVHARKAWLKGLSPKQNREIPPLDYQRVYRLKCERPELQIVINGGISSLDQAFEHLARVDGVMIGREAFQNPAMLLDTDRLLFDGGAARQERFDILSRYIDYARGQMAHGVYLKHLTPPLLGLFQGLPGTRVFKRHLADNAHRPGAGVEVLRAAAERAFGLDIAA